MNFKNCGAPLEDGQTVCPACGADQTADAASETETVLNDQAAAETEAPEASAEPAADESAEAGESGEAGALATESCEAAEEPAAPAPKKGGRGLLIGLIAAALVAVVALVFVISHGAKNKTAAQGSGETTSAASGETSKETTAADAALEIKQYVDQDGKFVAHDFQLADADVTDAIANQNVASCAGQKLTNAMLSYYYWQQYYNLLSNYGSYISYFLDTSKPLATQMYDDTHSWQDMLLQSSMAAFRQNAVACAAAEKAGFTLPEEYTSYLDSMSSNLDDSAKQSGYKDGEDYLKSFYGPYSTKDSYKEYARVTMTATAYLKTQYDKLQHTADDVSKYYDEHASEYKQKGIKKDDTKMINVRHILIKPVADSGAATDANGQATLTDKNWADAEAKAKEIYAAWKAGDATEDSFAAMAKKSSEDTGSASNGGLYENVYPGQMETAFNDWCFTAGRKAGDTDIVKTSYGYHVMYFSGTTDTAYWYSQAENDYVTAQQKKLTDDLIADSDFTVDYAKVALMESDLTAQAASGTKSSPEASESSADTTGSAAAETTTAAVKN